MSNKSLYRQISQPRETYIDGYGTTREVWEPEAVTAARKVYNAAKKFFNGPENVIGGAGTIELVNPTIALGPLAKISKTIKKYNEATSNLRRIQNESTALRIGTPSYANKYAKEAEHYNRQLQDARKAIQPYIDDGSLKVMFEKADNKALGKMMGDSKSPVLWDLKNEFWERYNELLDAKDPNAWRNATKELREQLGKLYKATK